MLQQKLPKDEKKAGTIPILQAKSCSRFLGYQRGVGVIPVLGWKNIWELLLEYKLPYERK